MNSELRTLVLAIISRHGHDRATDIIYAAHCGRLEGGINQGNVHLVRWYRNHVSASAGAMVDDATQ